MACPLSRYKDRNEALYDAALSVARNLRRRAELLEQENDDWTSSNFYDVDMAGLLQEQQFECGELRQNYRAALTALENVTGSRSNARMALALTCGHRFPKQLVDSATISFFSKGLQEAHDEGLRSRSSGFCYLPYPCRWVKDWPMTTPVNEEPESTEGAGAEQRHECSICVACRTAGRESVP